VFKLCIQELEVQLESFLCIHAYHKSLDIVLHLANKFASAPKHHGRLCCHSLNTIAKSPTLNPNTITKSAISGEHIDSLNVITIFHFVAKDLFNKKIKLLVHGPQYSGFFFSPIFQYCQSDDH
jgi:hypothetical protein